MAKSKRTRPERDISLTHPDAAAIDIGARMHVAAVPPDRRSPLSGWRRMTSASCVGATFQLAAWFGVAFRARNRRTIASGGRYWAYRPHMPEGWRGWR